ncbi:hypothetical protein APE_0237.1 [Aeropyrum pernix K1]|uniref:Chlorite dismutase n=1 Tax=Aeropyrum pernix (strain ATCC 700893 / DSM 11879 / JCM 9820 / NBRC 100138 / K1) TaxID=272557 RepID=Q9YFL1_AERPE|nr:chlorite dismutase family protein [Aeropyrum pernix]BAA79150.2 hypothetical protein APE_0237.1 [Aeropyrum pernix K1]
MELYIVVAGYSVRRGGSCPRGVRAAEAWRSVVSEAAESSDATVSRAYLNISGPGHLSLVAAFTEAGGLGRLRLELSRWGCVEEAVWWPAYYKESPYARSKTAEEVVEALKNSKFRFLVAYPMKKSPTWYLEPEEVRRRAMGEHIRIAMERTRENPVLSVTTYAFGIADYEFLVLYEVDSIPAWIETVEALRAAEARKWIIREEPVLLGLRL